jgi:hypothetical protein
MKIICFSSHTATWYFAFAEAVIASALQKRGHKVLFVTPGNQFPGLSDLRQEKILREEFDLSGYTIGTKLTKNDFKEIASIVKKLNRRNFDKLVIENVQIGKIALYEFLLHHKKIEIEFTQDEWKECASEIENALISFYACKKILKKEKPDRILMYSALYSVNRIWEQYAKYKRVPVYFMHHGSNLSDMDNTLLVAKNNIFYFFDKLKKYWLKLNDISLNRKMLSEVTDHFWELLIGKHYLVYSSPKSKDPVNIRKIFNINVNQKILTATMSSYDELFAAKYVGAWKLPNNPFFKNQTDWIKSLIDFVKQRQDLFLLIRVHPREFPNKRDSVKSEHVKMLERILKNLPANVKVNWPTDNISIYDLAQETDVFLNAWSSVGVEMSLLGIPVVIYSKDLVLYPPDLNYLGKNRKDYFSKIELALKDGWSYEKIKKTFRWLALYNCRTIMRFRKKPTRTERLVASGLVFSVLENLYSILPLKARLFIVKLAMAAPGLGVDKKQRDECKRQLTEKVDISNLEEMLLNSDDTLVDVKKILVQRISNKDEDRYIHREVKRMYEFMYGKVSKGVDIKKNNLQYNLKNSLSLK